MKGFRFGVAALLAATLGMTGCATVFDGPRPARDEVSVRIVLVADENMPPGVAGDTVCGPSGRCLVRIRRSTYPLCVTHEIRHAFEPGFHAGRESDESCYVKK